MRTDWPLKNGLCTIAMRTKMARNSGRSDIAWGRMGPSVGRSDPQWGRMLSTWDVKYSFNNIYAISSSSHSLVVWVLHTLRCPLAHSKYSGIFFISGVTHPERTKNGICAPPQFMSALSSSWMCCPLCIFKINLTSALRNPSDYLAIPETRVNSTSATGQAAITTENVKQP
jgi:hypothetical protein